MFGGGDINITVIFDILCVKSFIKMLVSDYTYDKKSKKIKYTRIKK